MDKKQTNTNVEEKTEQTPAAVAIDELAQATSDEQQPGGEEKQQETEGASASKIIEFLSTLADGKKCQQMISLISDLAVDRFVTGKKPADFNGFDDLFEANKKLAERLKEYVDAMIAVDISHGIVIDYDAAKQAKDEPIKSSRTIIIGDGNGFGSMPNSSLLNAIIGGGMGGFGRPSGMPFGVMSGFGQPSVGLGAALLDIINDISSDEQCDDDDEFEQLLNAIFGDDEPADDETDEDAGSIGEDVIDEDEPDGETLEDSSDGDVNNSAEMQTGEPEDEVNTDQGSIIE